MTDFDTISGGPNWRTLSDADLFERAHNLPTSYGRMAWEQVKESAITSYGLGTVLREAQTPPPVPAEDDIPAPLPARPGSVESPEAYARRRAREAVTAERRKELGAITKDEYEAGPSYRKTVPYDPGMTRDRAAALAAWNDEAEYRRSLIERGPKGIFSGALRFGSMFAGSALDPINYIPMASQAMRAAAMSRFGTVSGSALVASADAAANTALFGLLTRQNRASFGDDVTWQAMASDIAMGALVGAAFGGGVGAYQRWQTNRSLHDLQRVQEARMALDDAIGDLVQGRPPSLPQDAARLVTDLREMQFPHLTGTGVGRFGDMPEFDSSGARVALRAEMPVMPRSDDPTLAGLQDTLVTLRGVPGNVTDKGGIVVWHGTPHDFERFDLGKIGTGEGNQAFGHGLYFASKRGIAEYYQNMLTRTEVTVGGKPFNHEDPAHFAAEMLDALGDRNKAAEELSLRVEAHKQHIKELEADIAEAMRMAGDGDKKVSSAYLIDLRDRNDRARKDLKLVIDARDIARSDVALPEYKEAQVSHLYEVRIKAKPDEFLDWDKPLSEQSPAVQKAIKDAARQFGMVETDGQFAAWADGATLYTRMSGKSTSDPKPAAALKEAGIKGIRFLDGNSRGAGEGTFNYVVFDDGLLQIVGKNGQPVKVDMPVREFLAMQGQATAKSVQPMTAKTQQPIVVAEPRPEAPDPKEQKAAATIGKRPASLEEEFGLAGDEAASPEILEFNQLKDRGRLQQQEIDAFARAAEIEQTANAYADGLTAAALCRVA